MIWPIKTFIGWHPRPSASKQLPSACAVLFPASSPTERRAADCSVWNCVRCACCRTTAALLRLTSRLLLRKGTISKRQLANPHSSTKIEKPASDPISELGLRFVSHSSSCPLQNLNLISSSILFNGLILQPKAKKAKSNTHHPCVP